MSSIGESTAKLDERIQKIMQKIPKNLASIVDPAERSEVLAQHMTLIFKSKCSDSEKLSKCCKLLLDYMKSKPAGCSFDPSEIETYLLEFNNMAGLLICEWGTQPDACISDLDSVLKFLGTSRAEIIDKQGKFTIDVLRKEMVHGRDFEVKGKARDGKDIILVSHYGMRKIARRLTTPQANIMYECMSACYDVVKDSSAQLSSFYADRTINLGEHKLITELLDSFTFESTGGANLLLNIERQMLRICFGMGKASLIQVCGIDGAIRDASAKQQFITFSTAVRDRLRKRLQNAARDAPGGVISAEEEGRIFDETVSFIEYYVRDWADVSERIRDFLVCVLLDHRDEVVLRSGRKVPRPLQVSSRQVRARRTGP
jgi:hypothetical protein